MSQSLQDMNLGKVVALVASLFEIEKLRAKLVEGGPWHQSIVMLLKGL